MIYDPIQVHISLYLERDIMGTFENSKKHRISQID